MRGTLKKGKTRTSMLTTHCATAALAAGAAGKRKQGVWRIQEGECLPRPSDQAK